MEKLFEGIDKEKNNRFKLPWIKLDKGSKLNRIYLYIQQEKLRLELNDKEENQFKSLVLNLFNSNSLNRSSEIDYCLESCLITNIKNLKFEEKTRKFNYFSEQKKSNNGGSKSKTNIEKHFNRSKDSKELKVRKD